MSPTEASPSPHGKKDDRSFNEGETSEAPVPIDSGSSSAAQDDGLSNLHEDLQQRNMSTEPTPEAQASADPSVPIATPSVRAPSPHDPLAGQMEGLAVSAKNTSNSLPSPVSDTSPAPPPPEKDDAYLKSTSTPPAPASQSAGESNSGPSSEKDLPDVPGDSNPDSRQPGQDEGARDDNDSQPEIQSIMRQFQDPIRSTGQDEIMSPRLELADQFRGAQNYFPPRKSSLDYMKSPESGSSTVASPEIHPTPTASKHSHHYEESVLTRQSSTSTIPPPPEPEPDQPFDFHRFLEQLRHRTADPVAKYLRSFLMEFGKRQWMVHEQVKIISDFLAFITNIMALCEVWRDVSDSEFDNAKEGMEKLVMNRLYSQTFSPAIPAPPSIPRSASRSRRREIERLHGPWRRGQHQEDIERDDILAQKIRIYSWVSEEHLDIPPVSGSGRRFLNLAQQGML